MAVKMTVLLHKDIRFLKTEKSILAEPVTMDIPASLFMSSAETISSKPNKQLVI